MSFDTNSSRTKSEPFSLAVVLELRIAPIIWSLNSTPLTTNEKKTIGFVRQKWKRPSTNGRIWTKTLSNEMSTTKRLVNTGIECRFIQPPAPFLDDTRSWLGTELETGSSGKRRDATYRKETRRDLLSKMQQETRRIGMVEATTHYLFHQSSDLLRSEWDRNEHKIRQLSREFSDG